MLTTSTLLYADKANLTAWDQDEVITLRTDLVPILNYTNCTTTKTFIKTPKAENMICVGVKDCKPRGLLTCARDRGSKEIQDHKIYLCGLGSSATICSATSGLPIPYTDVSKYTRWIGKFMRTWERYYRSRLNYFIPLNFPQH